MNFLTPQQQMAMSMQVQPPVNPYNPMQGMDPSGFAPPGQLMNQMQQPMFRPVPRVSHAFGLGSNSQNPVAPASGGPFVTGAASPSNAANPYADRDAWTLHQMQVNGDAPTTAPTPVAPQVAAPVATGTGSDSLRQQIADAMQQMLQAQQVKPAPASQPLIPRPTPVPTPAPTPSPQAAWVNPDIGNAGGA